MAALAVDALGARVLGVTIPSPYTSERSLNDAKKLTDNLGIELRTIPIATVYAEFRKLLGRNPEDFPDLVDENLQARIRGTLLMALANARGALLLSTGNKSEMAVGYCTLYGDMAGGLALIADLPKTMVYQLARYINRQKERIPQSIIDRPPSAELCPNQCDQDALPPYELLDPILRGYIEDGRSATELIADGLPAEMVAEVLSRVNRNEYKRRQAPPGIQVTGKSFGIGRRLPIAGSWKGWVLS